MYQCTKKSKETISFKVEWITVKTFFCEKPSNFEKISLTEQERGITFGKVKTLLWMQYLSTKIIQVSKLS